MRKLAIAAVMFAALAAPRAPAQASYWARYYASGPASAETELVMAAGSTRDVVVRYANRGLYLWRGGGQGWRYVSLYSVEPYARKSAFRHPAWKSDIQPAALWEYRVWPGETGTFRFTLRAPEAPGTYVERFHMAIEDTAWVDGGRLTLNIRVVPKDSLEAASLGPGVAAKAWLVMDAGTGKVLEEKNADEVRSIASLTKLMTAMVALQDVAVDRSRAVTLASGDEVGGARLQVSTGSTWTAGHLLASTLIGSTNNTAYALARSSDDSVSEFVRKMNQRATAMGLSKTRFVDPTGIEVANVSTAREVAYMALNAFADPTIRHLTAQPTFRVETADGAGYRTITNTNSLLSDASLEVTAGKTGYLIEAGWTLATQLKRPGKRELLVVVLGCADRAQSMRDAKRLAEWTWEKS